MGRPVKVSDDLASIAKEEAESAHRSVAAQIEHWAVLGRAAEMLLGHREIAALKRFGGGAVASVGSPRARVEEKLAALARDEDRGPALARVKASGGPRYGHDAKGRIVRIDPDGTRTVGTFVDGAFVPSATRLRRVPKRS